MPYSKNNVPWLFRFDWKVFWTAAGIVGLAAFLRLYQIEKQQIWFDEAGSFHSSVSANWLKTMQLDPNPPLYFLLLRGWVSLAGTSELSLRLPSAIAGSLFVIVVIWAGLTLFDNRTGLWSGAFAAVAPMHIYYSQEARGYSLLLLMLLLTYVVLWRALEKNSPWAWIAVFVCEAAAVGTHYLAVVGLLPTLFLVLMWPEKEGRSKRWFGYLAAGLGSGIVLLPWLVWSQIWAVQQTRQADWISDVWNATPPSLAILKSLEVLAMGTHAGHLPLSLKQMTVLEFPFSLRVLGLAILMFLGLLVAIPWGDKTIDIPWLGRRKLMLGALALSPLVVMWIGSIFLKPFYVAGRYDMLAFPAFALLVGFGLNKLQAMKPAGPYLTLVITLAFFSAIGVKLLRYYGTPSAKTASDTARLLDRNVKNSDVVIFTGGGQAMEVLYQLYRMGYDDGYCRNDEQNRNFQCRMLYGFSDHRWLGRHHSIDPSSSMENWMPQRVGYFVDSLWSPGSTLWVVLWPGGKKIRFPEGKLIVGSHELRLFEELKHRGFVRKHLADAPWIVLFSKS